MVERNERKKTINIRDVQTGDLLAWRRNSENRFSDALIRAIAFSTRYRYGHVGIAFRERYDGTDTLYVFEASIPNVKLTKITDKTEVFCVKANLQPNARSLAFLLNVIGSPYGLMDAVMSFFGMNSRKDDHWQCAELSKEFYRLNGVVLRSLDIPGRVVKKLEKLNKTKATRVVFDRPSP